MPLCTSISQESCNISDLPNKRLKCYLSIICFFYLKSRDNFQIFFLKNVLEKAVEIKYLPELMRLTSEGNFHHFEIVQVILTMLESSDEEGKQSRMQTTIWHDIQVFSNNLTIWISHYLSFVDSVFCFFFLIMKSYLFEIYSATNQCLRFFFRIDKSWLATKRGQAFKRQVVTSRIFKEKEG